MTLGESTTTKCERCGCVIPNCQRLCFRCEWKTKEEEEDKEMREQEKKDEYFWRIVHER